MDRLPLVFRFLSLILWVTLPVALLGFFLLGLKGIIGAFLFSFFWTLGVAIGAEWWVQKALPIPLESQNEGVESVKNATLLGLGQRTQLKVFEDPFPWFFRIRSLGRPETLFLSRGLMSLLNQEELKSVLEGPARKAQELELVFRSLSLILAAWTLNLAPRSWALLLLSDRPLSMQEQEKLTPSTAFGFLFLVPVVQFFLKLSGERSPSLDETSLRKEDCSAVQKIRQAACLRGLGSQTPTEKRSVCFFYSSEIRLN